MTWWIELGYPPFEKGRDGFPYVGQVVKHYREQKKDRTGRTWSQKDLARHLEITEHTVQGIERGTVGIDHERRHFLCPLLDIPPILLGIVTLQEIEARVEQEKATKTVSPLGSTALEQKKSFWWVELGYPAFAPGKNGFPRPGGVVKHYRERKIDHEGHPYTQSDLAQILGITEQSARYLENKDIGMDDLDRRHFLSKWLNIPPILLGVITLEQIQKMGEKQGLTLSTATSEPVFVSGPGVTGYKLAIDPKEYREKLDSYWQIDYSRDAYGTLGDSLLRTSAMYQELPHVNLDERYQLHELLCSYHQFIAYLLRDKQMYDGAIIHANKAFQMAKLLSDDEQKALALYSRGYIFWSANRMNSALIDFENARKHERNLPVYLNGPVHLFSGLVKSIDAKNKRDQQGQKDALLLLDRGGNIVRAARSRENPHFIDFSLNRYHGVKSLALMAVGKNKEAIDELKLIKPYANVHGQVYYDISLAQARASLGDYSEAARLAASTLPIVQEINSEINIARIERVYQQLLQGPYKNSPDVARLDYLLHYKQRGNS